MDHEAGIEETRSAGVSLAFKPQKTTTELANEFIETAAEALSEGDDAAAFNAAADFAQSRGLGSQTMALVLAVLRQRSVVTPEVQRHWRLEAADVLGERRRPEIVDAVVNEAVVTHAVDTDWQYAPIVGELSLWFGRFNHEFFHGELPVAAISVEAADHRNLGWYRPGRDGLALRHRININSRNLHRGLADRLETLLHEMVHEWEEAVGGRQGGGSYHTKAFRTKAQGLGIPSTSQGCSVGIVPDGPFARLLAKHHIPLGSTADEAQPPQQPPAPRSSLAKWVCGCTNIWAARGVEVDGHCDKCDQPWQRAA